MKKIYLSSLVAVFIGFLAGCQSNPPTPADPLNKPPKPARELFSFGHSNQNLAAAVHSAFMSTPELSAVPIHIETQRGTVFLSGYVKTIRQSDMAGELASRVPGAKSVHNGLIVRK